MSCVDCLFAKAESALRRAPYPCELEGCNPLFCFAGHQTLTIPIDAFKFNFINI